MITSIVLEFTADGQRLPVYLGDSRAEAEAAVRAVKAPALRRELHQLTKPYMRKFPVPEAAESTPPADAPPAPVEPAAPAPHPPASEQELLPPVTTPEPVAPAEPVKKRPSLAPKE